MKHWTEVLTNDDIKIVLESLKGLQLTRHIKSEETKKFHPESAENDERLWKNLCDITRKVDRELDSNREESG